MPTLEEIRLGLSSKDEDERWQAAIAAEELLYSDTDPETVWGIVLEFGKSANSDVRAAIATCVLEHLLEHHFKAFFPKLEAEIAKGSARLEDTFKTCWRFGQSKTKANSRRWDMLKAVIEDNERRRSRKARAHRKRKAKG